MKSILVTIIHGATNDVFRMPSRIPIYVVRDLLRDAFNLSNDTVSFVNGQLVPPTWELSDQDLLEFVVPSGQKGSKGSQAISVRIPGELLALIDEAVDRSADTRKDAPWTRSSFILKAIEEKLAKMARSAGKPQSPVPGSYKRDSYSY